MLLACAHLCKYLPLWHFIKKIALIEQNFIYLFLYWVSNYAFLFLFHCGLNSVIQYDLLVWFIVTSPFMACRCYHYNHIFMFEFTLTLFGCGFTGRSEFFLHVFRLTGFISINIYIFLIQSINWGISRDAKSERKQEIWLYYEVSEGPKRLKNLQ